MGSSMATVSSFAPSILCVDPGPRDVSRHGPDGPLTLELSVGGPDLPFGRWAPPALGFSQRVSDGATARVDQEAEGATPLR